MRKCGTSSESMKKLRKHEKVFHNMKKHDDKVCQKLRKYEKECQKLKKHDKVFECYESMRKSAKS